jgi:CHAT domain-containing protein
LRALHLRGKLAAAAGRLESAIASYRQAEQLVERLRLGLRAEELKLAFVRDKQELYEDAVAACLASRWPRRREQAFEFAERAKSRALLELLDADLRAREEVPQAHRSRWRVLRGRLNTLYRQLGEQERRGKRRDLELDRSLSHRILRVEEQLERLRGEAGSSRRVGPSLDQLKRKLRRDETLVEYFGRADSLVAFVLTRDQLRIVNLPGAQQRTRELEFALRFQMQKFHYNSGYVDRHEPILRATCDRLLADLYDTLLAPLGPLPGRRLLFVLHGPLHYLPLPALRGPAGYLVDHYEIAVGPSAAVLLYPARRRRVTRAPLVIGADDGSLPYVREEAKAVAAQHPQARLLLGEGARQEDFLRLARGSAWIHIAAHGIYRDDNPLFSAVALADGWLTYHDLLGMPLSAELVVLSGCDTGRHRIDAGDELLGLARGFLRAGVSNLVVSLWAVQDRATATLMKDFHARWRDGSSVPAALRQASLALRRTHPHPYYWAPFVVVGRCAGGKT